MLEMSPSSVASLSGMLKAWRFQRNNRCDACSLVFAHMAQVHLLQSVSDDTERAERLRRAARGHRREPLNTDHLRAGALHPGAKS